MTISYNRLWKLLIDRRMTRTQLRLAAGISTTILAQLGKDNYVSLDSLYKICRALGCNIGDVCEFVFEPDEQAAE